MSKIRNVQDSASLVVDCKSLTLRWIILYLFKVVAQAQRYNDIWSLEPFPSPHLRSQPHLSYTHYNRADTTFFTLSQNSAPFEIKTQWNGITCMQLTSPKVPISKTIQLRLLPRSSSRAIIYKFSSKCPNHDYGPILFAFIVVLTKDLERESRKTKVDKASSGFVDILRWSLQCQNRSILPWLWRVFWERHK